jgi:hypothetical protein
MQNRPRIHLAGALVAVLSFFTVAGCATAPTGGETMTDGGGKAAEPAAPTVSEDKQNQAQQLAENAEKVMLDPDLAPREKYPEALGMFRDALEIDPNNALAKESVRLIEDIYTSMGRPVPQ